MILAPRNTDVNLLNTSMLANMPGQEFIFYSADTIENELGADDYVEQFPVEYLRSLEASGLPSGELHMKPGCSLLLL